MKTRPLLLKSLQLLLTPTGGQVEAQSVEKGNTAVEPKDPVKNGYVFKGWTL
ncbi:InlB B-repeat-containing protein, partial [Bullifex porci]|uniref:InlB B-repeat-containing protein n=1 Tax=Bullifex porci TaxID=2606638 RepID=UPI003C6C6E6B